MTGIVDEMRCCECGCGTTLPIPRYPSLQKRFIKGHHSRARNVPACGYVVTNLGYTSPCWVWGLDRDRDGYGKTRRNKATIHAHIAFWTDLHGPRAVTPSTNLRRSHRVVLDVGRAREIRELASAGWRHADIADAYATGRRHVGKIASGEIWAESDAAREASDDNTTDRTARI